MPAKLPLPFTLLEAAAPREEIASSRLSLEEEIDQFQLVEEEEVQVDPIKLSDFEDGLDRSSTARHPKLMIVEVDSDSEDEGIMALNQGRA